MNIYLDDKEEVAFDTFCKSHASSCKMYLGAIGGHISLLLTFTSLGTAFSVICNVCGEEENITNYDCW
jgi:hypothetical protein